MKAVVVSKFGPVSNAKHDERAEPVPGAGQIVVDIHAAEANFPDILVMEGAYQIKPPLPFSPGKAGAGVISALGDSVTGFSVGDRVGVQVEYGTYAEKLLTDAATCYPMPEGMGFDVAAALGLVYQTSHFALVERGRMKAGERVLVLGATGGIGSAACQLAKALGAGQVIGGLLDLKDEPLAKQLGCDTVVSLAGDDLRDRLRQDIHEATGGAGVDVVIDPVGGTAFAAALRAMAWRGRLVVIGFASGDIPSVKANYLLVKNIEVSGLQWSDYRERDPEWVARVQNEIYGLWRAGKLSPHISDRLPLSQFSEALERLRRGEVRGKLILEPGA
ncbi:MAG: NADPH:quinone oxidoreductase family protein [Pseudomonadota bacterium]